MIERRAGKYYPLGNCSGPGVALDEPGGAALFREGPCYPEAAARRRLSCSTLRSLSPRLSAYVMEEKAALRRLFAVPKKGGGLGRKPSSGSPHIRSTPKPITKKCGKYATEIAVRRRLPAKLVTKLS